MTGARPLSSSFVPDSCTLPARGEAGWDKCLLHVDRRLGHIGRWAGQARVSSSASGRKGTEL